MFGVLVDGIFIGVEKPDIFLLFQYRKLVQGSLAEELDLHLSLARCFLDLARRRQCKDGRDRIYGMLSIIPDAGVLPDYSLSLKQVYMNFVSATLGSGDFSIPHACSIDRADPSMPSYVPSLEVPDYTGVPKDTFFDCRPFRAGSDRHAGVEMNEEGNMTLNGIHIDTGQGNLDFNEKLKSLETTMSLLWLTLSPVQRNV